MNHRNIITKWPDIDSLARDMAVPPLTAAGWWNRNSIPARYWTELVIHARQKGYSGVTFENLANGIARKVAA